MATFQNVLADLTFNLDADIPTMLSGPAGVGKSDLVRQASRAYGGGFIDFRAVLRDAVDLRGLPMPDAAAGLTRWLPAGDLPNVDRDGPRGVLFLDELPQATPMVQAACFGLVLDRRVGEYVLPDDWRIVAAGNRRQDRAASNGLLGPLANRFAHLSLDVDTTGAEWCAWAAANGVPPELIAFIRFRAPKGLLHAVPAGPGAADVLAFPTPRSWARAARCVPAPDGQRFRLIAANVGEGAAAEFEGFLQVWRGLPALSSILADPHGSKVPGATDSALLYALAGALARAADRSNFDAVVTYADRLPGEFSVLTVTDATGRDPGLKDTAAYVNWCVRHQHVTM